MRPGALASLRPDVSVPRSARGTFARAVPCRVGAGGFYLSLGPSLAAQLSGSPNLVWGGVITFLLTGLGAVTSFAFRNSAPPAVMPGGCLGLLCGALAGSGGQADAVEHPAGAERADEIRGQQGSLGHATPPTRLSAGLSRGRGRGGVFSSHRHP